MREDYKKAKAGEDNKKKVIYLSLQNKGFRASTTYFRLCNMNCDILM